MKQILLSLGLVLPLLAHATPELPPITVIQTVKLEHGTTLAEELQKTGLSAQEVYSLTHKINRHFRLSRMPAGTAIKVKYTEAAPHQPGPLELLEFHTPDDRTITAMAEGNDFNVQVADRQLERRQMVAIGRIDGSLYAAAKEAGLPVALVPSFANIFNWELDFTRDIRPGDPFKVVFDMLYDENGEVVRTGAIHAAQIYSRGKERHGYRYEYAPGRYSYYDEKGNAKRRMLIRTPLNFTRISSHYNLKRMHPVLKYTRAHRGTDFAAPTGTPVWAAGDGVIERANRFGSYGKYVRIRHDSKYKTAYAHLHTIARGMKPGTRVRQGDVIGTVGSTGRSTGPHLHYEIIVNGEKVNPMKVRLPGGKALPKNKRSDFLRMAEAYQAKWNQAEIRLAQAN